MSNIPIKGPSNKKETHYRKIKIFSVEPLNLFCSFLLEHYDKLCCFNKAECCARITVFHKLNDSESVAVRRYLMLVV